MLDGSLKESSSASVEVAVSQVCKMWALLNLEAPPAALKFAGNEVKVTLGAVESALPGVMWTYAAKMGVKGGMEVGAVRLILMLGLEFGAERADQILRDGVALTQGLLAPGARPWLEPGFEWRATTWRNVREAAVARYLENCESRQIRRLLAPMFLARWYWIERNVVEVWKDILPGNGS